jgi:dynein heavy chain
LKENLHIILAMSPFSGSFKTGIAKYPALLNCCSINWINQWPDDALNFVSKRLLQKAKIGEAEINGCVSLCEYFNSSTIALSKEVKVRLGLHNYVTPASYLELNKLFKDLLLKHRQMLEETRKMYEVSLDKLKSAEGQVNIMHEEMAAVQPSLSEASQEVDAYMTLVEKEQIELVELEKMVKTDDIVVTDKKKMAELLSNDCEHEFTEVNAVLETALDSLAALSPSEIAAVRGLKSPSSCLKLNMEALCLYKGVKPDRLPDVNAPGKMADDYWSTAKKQLADPKFVENLSAFDKENIAFKTAKLIRDKYIGNSDINPEKAKSSIPAIDNVSHALYSWIVAIDMYDKVARNTAPKRELLTKSENENQEAVEQLNNKKCLLKTAQEKLKVISLTLQQMKEKKAELENDVEMCSRKLERAEQLISGFGCEREKWSLKKNQLSKKLNQLNGDILLCAGMVAYLGAFPSEERYALIVQWKKKADEYNISYSHDWSLRSVLGDPITIQNWYMNGLLQDDFSTDNAIIQSTANRWVLMIDPDDIANRWIRTTEKTSISVLKQSDKDFLRSLETSIQFGYPVLLENVGETLEPALEPLLLKQTFQQGGSTCIKLGESTIEFSRKFRMYMTTRLKNPHFPPETASKITLLNFSITDAGLVHQLLGIILARERPELEEEKSQLFAQMNDNRKNMEEIENNILNVLFTSSGNILEDENAIKSLSSSKVLVNELFEKHKSSLTTNERIETNRQQYMELTNYAVTLFSSVSVLSSINHMYQFSLSWFVNLFCSSMDGADKSENLTDRLKLIKNHFLQSLFANTVIGLFEDDKLIYSFILACNLSPYKDQLFEKGLWNLLLKCVSTDNRSDLNNKSKQKSVEDKIAQIMENESFCHLQEQSLMQLLDATKVHSDEEFKQLNPAERLVLVVYLHPDKVIHSIREFVVATLGEKFIDEEPLDIGKAYSESVAATPLIFILGKDVDPLKYIFRFAEESGFPGNKLKLITLGSGQEDKASEIINESYQTSAWVVLINCHLVPEWMDELEYHCDQLSGEATNPEFRLWITTRPHKCFSVLTLQLSFKIALEEPSKLKANLIRHLCPDKLFGMKFNKQSTICKKITFALALFHAVINQRRTYPQCGWNQNYIFGEVDFDYALSQLTNISGANESTFSTLRYLLAKCTYGGQMEDELDIRTLETFLQVACPDDLDNHQLMLNDTTRFGNVPVGTHTELMTFLASLPTDTAHLVMNMSKATHKQKNVMDGRELLLKLKSIRSLMFSETRKEHIDDYEEDSLRDKMLLIYNDIPDQFDLVENETEILKLVLDQELQKYNCLLEMIAESLSDALRAIDGKCLVTKKISCMLRSIEEDEIPDMWMDVAYPTIEDLQGFLKDLKKRTRFLRSWQKKGRPEEYWISALFEPGDFLIAILYIASLNYGRPYHELTLECRFDKNQQDQAAERQGILVKGLFLIGASWDIERNVLIESHSDESNCEIPVMRLVPVPEEDVDDQNMYECPMFQNSERSGDDNYVINLKLPTELPPETWILRGVALLSQPPKPV